MSKDLSKDVLGAIKKKTGKTISTNSISKIANTVKPGTLENDAELRKLVRSVADMANIKLSDEQLDNVLNTVKASGVKSSNMEALMRLLIK